LPFALSPERGDNVLRFLASVNTFCVTITEMSEIQKHGDHGDAAPPEQESEDKIWYAKLRDSDLSLISVYDLVTWVGIPISISLAVIFGFQQMWRAFFSSVIGLLTLTVVMLAIRVRQHHRAIDGQRSQPTESPELFVEHVTPHPILVGKPVTMRMIVRNRGKATAHKVRVGATHALFKSSLNEPLRYWTQPANVSPSIGSNASFEYISVSTWIIQRQHLIDLKARDVLLFHYGKGTYEDKSGKEFVFQFCAMFEPSVSTMVLCPDTYIPISLSEDEPVKRPVLYVKSAAVNLVAGHTIDVYVVLTNQGEGSASEIWLDGVTSIKPKSFTGPLERKGMTRSDIPASLAPGMDMTTTLREGRRWTKQSIAKLKRGDQLLFHYARGGYKDERGNAFPLEFCLRYEAGLPMARPGMPYLGFADRRFWPEDDTDKQAEPDNPN
jgi:hypothetical protein